MTLDLWQIIQGNIPGCMHQCHKRQLCVCVRTCVQKESLHSPGYFETLCRPSWPQTHRNPPTSPSQELGLKSSLLPARKLLLLRNSTEGEFPRNLRPAPFLHSHWVPIQLMQKELQAFCHITEELRCDRGGRMLFDLRGLGTWQVGATALVLWRCKFIAGSKAKPLSS